MNFPEVEKILKESGITVCAVCGTPFSPYHSRQKTCGAEECKEQYHREYMRNAIVEADEEREAELRRRHADANKRWRQKKKKLKQREAQLDEIIERTQRQIDFDNYIKEHGLEYGKLQAQKTLASIPKIDVNIVGAKETKK